MPERDPDLLLEAFVALTDRAPAPPVNSLKRSITGQLVRIAIAAASVAAVAVLAAVYALKLSPTGDEGGTQIPPSSVAEATRSPQETNATSPPPTRSARPTGRLDIEPAPWTVDAALPIGPATTSLNVLLRHDACAIYFVADAEVLPPVITYGVTEVAITFRVGPSSALAGCEWGIREDRAIVPTRVELREPLGERALVDASTDPPTVRWRPPPADAVPLPTKRTDPWPLGEPFIETCDGVGLSAFIAGAPDDPRLVWLENRRGESGPRSGLYWPPGFTARFRGGVEVLNEAGEVVRRERDRVDGACVVEDELTLYGSGILPLTPSEPPTATPSPQSMQHERAMTLALADPLLLDYLARNPHGDPTAAAYLIPGGAQPSVPAIIVRLEFDDFADDWPLGSCDIYREIEQPVGVAWLIDESGSEILARSPVWLGGTDCFA